MAVSAALVRIEVLAVIHDAGWCRECLLPSGVRAVLATTSGGRSSLRTIYRCDECGGDQIDPAPGVLGG